MLMFPGTGFNLVHVDDVADGIVLAHDQGRIGESYVLGGEVTTMGELIEKVAGIAGRKPPQREHAGAAHEDGDPDRPGGRQGAGLSAEPAAS